MSARFTIDGGPELEAHLAGVCADVASGIRGLLPEQRLEGLVLGGGYGRGQGGVLLRDGRERPYNDMEFYVFMRGNRLLNERRYREGLAALGGRLSPAAGLHVEFKIESLGRFRQSVVSMFSYDLVSGHRILIGEDDFFERCSYHLRAEGIPLSEATRLLVNRCTGLLLAQESLGRNDLAAEDVDFICRNIAKARLALGDAVLATLGLYHWSCLERHARLLRLQPAEVAGLECLDQVRCEHRAGVQFKLHPASNAIPQSSADHVSLQESHRSVSALAERVWLWVESRRLDREFASTRQYAEYPEMKWNEGPGWRNCLLNCRTFGLKGALDPLARRYPRERLLNSLPLLLWHDGVTEAPVQRHLQHQLQTRAEDWNGFVGAYKSVWPGYG